MIHIPAEIEHRIDLARTNREATRLLAEHQRETERRLMFNATMTAIIARLDDDIVPYADTEMPDGYRLREPWVDLFDMRVFIPLRIPGLPGISARLLPVFPDDIDMDQPNDEMRRQISGWRVSYYVRAGGCSLTHERDEWVGNPYEAECDNIDDALLFVADAVDKAYILPPLTPVD